MKTKSFLMLVSLTIAILATVACDAREMSLAETGTPSLTTAIGTEASQGESLAENELEEPTTVENDTPSTPEIEPIEIIAFTPSQQEGPYYPVDKPADRDNDLVNMAGATADPVGEVLNLSGVVYDANGLPVEGVVIEIWQTDSNGVYNHPGDPGTDRRDPNFQFYGESMTGADGVYSFWTILPGLYEPRPRHIHVKIKLDGEELLTTQFYFGDEVTLGGAEANLIVDIAPAEDDDGAPIWVGARDIFLNLES